MSAIDLTTRIAAPPERCFDLARSVAVHLHSTDHTGEEVVEGRRTGLFEAGETVTWRARHLGIRQELTVRIDSLDRPRHFRDSQVRGAFRYFTHDHWFERDGAGGTIARERFTFAAPFGPIGTLVERAVLVPYLRRFLAGRASAIKELAEGEGWREFLPETPPG